MKVSRRIEAALLTALLVCLGALGLRAATQGMTGFDPSSATVGNARLLAFAITQYEQDSDELLPPTDTQAHFQAALLPFIHDPLVFISPEAGKPFQPNPAISYHSISQFADPGTVVLFQDAPPGPAPVIAYLDGHIERGGVEQGDPRLISIRRANRLTIGVAQYAGDHGYLPPMQNPQEFQAALYPNYVPSRRFFTDLLNKKPFLPNAAVSGEPFPADYMNTEVVREDTPYLDAGVPIIGYLGGRVTSAPHPEESNPSAVDVAHLSQIGLAVEQYVQDTDNYTLPTTTDYGQFQSELTPYLRGVADPFFQPETNLPYVLNSAVSGVALFSIADPGNVEILRDPQRNRDGSFNYITVNGGIHQDLFFVPKALSIGPDDETHMLGPKATGRFLYGVGTPGQAALWTLTPSGTTLTEDTETISEQDKAIAFSIGGDDRTRLVWSRMFFTAYSNPPITGAIELDTFGLDNSLEGALRYGPYDGWTPLLLATAPDNTSRLLWRRYNGVFALWNVSPEGEYLGYVPLPPVLNKTPLGMARGSDDRTRLLGRTTAGAATLLTFSPTDQLQSMARFAPHPGFAVTALALGPDNAPRLLWDNGAGKAEVWTLNAAGKLAHVARFSLAAGYTATQLAVGQAGDLRVLWTASDGSGRLQTLRSSGRVVGVRDLTPYQ